MLTQRAFSTLKEAPVLFTPTPHHPALAHLPPQRVRLLAHADPAAAANVLLAHTREGNVYCALPGHPREHRITGFLTEHIHSCPMTIIPGLSLVESKAEIWNSSPSTTDHATNGWMASTQVMQVLDAAALLPSTRLHSTAEPAWCELQGVATYVPPIIPYPLNTFQPALIRVGSIAGEQRAAEIAHIQATLLLRYPPAHPLRLLRLESEAQASDEKSLTVSLETLASQHLDEDENTSLAAIFVPPLMPAANRRSFEGLAWIVMHLLAPDGCPWDRKQTFQSLRSQLLEETYEVLEALDSQDMSMLSEELGDLLLQVVVQSEMARQSHTFTVEDVLEQVSTKLIRRHPHVFGHLDVAGADEVLANWEQIKAQELVEKGRQRSSALDGVPPGMPALATAQKLVKKAARAGFDWNTREDVWSKLREELDELLYECEHDDGCTAEERQARLAEEFGDVLFAAVNLGRWLNLDVESTLREANAKFYRRFTVLERLAHRKGLHLATMAMDEKLALWNEARRTCSEGG
jgi:tetrapyrrole methylase family protein/MazG family protein